MEKTYLEVNLDSITRNFQTVRSIVGSDVKIIAVVKANGYGHGMVEVSRALNRAGADMLGVAFPFEGAVLRRAGIKLPILVMGGMNPSDMKEIIRFSLTPAIGNCALLKELERTADRNVEIHLKLDTGMTRLGMPLDDAYELTMKLIKNAPGRLRLSGIMTHFAESDVKGSEYSSQQVDAFSSFYKKIGSPPGLMCHCANSGAIVNMREAHLQAVRPGIMLYGYLPCRALAAKVDIIPAGSWKTEVVDTKRIRKGTHVGYGRSFTAKNDMLLAFLPVGYGDGYSRKLSSCGSVLLRGKKALVIGRVSMDTVVVDITEIRDVYSGETAVLMGSDGNEVVSAYDMAEKEGTIPYEVLTSISARVPRKYLPALSVIQDTNDADPQD